MAHLLNRFHGMSKKVFLFLLIPGLLLTGGYLAVQVYLRSGIKKEAKQELAAVDTAGSRTVQASVPKVDSLGGRKTSPLDLRPLFLQRLQLLIKKSSNNLYNLFVDDMQVDLLASTVLLTGVRLQPDKAVLEALGAKDLLPANVITVSFRQLAIDGINLDDAVNSKKMDYKSIRLFDPVIEIDHRYSQKKTANEDFSQRFLKGMESLAIGKIQVNDGTIVVHNKQQGTTKRLAGMQVLLSDVLLNENTRSDRNRFLFAKAARIGFQNFRTKTKDGLYTFGIGEVAIDAVKKEVLLKRLSFASPLSKKTFVRKQKVAKELYSLSLPQVTIKGVDWFSLLNGEVVVADHIGTNGGKMAVYFNRGLPPRNRMGNFPNQLLMKLPTRLNIGTLDLRNLDISYEEFNPVSQQSGTLYLDKASLTIRHLHNARSSVPVTVSGTALLAHKVPVHASFRLDMDRYHSGVFSAAIRLPSPFEGSLINSVAVPLGLLKIDKGTLQRLQVNMQGNENGASGNVEVLYNDLKLSLLEKDNGKAALDKKDVTSFLANLLVLKKDNPKEGKPPRRETARFQRDPEGGFLMLVWKTVLVGILKTIGAPQKMAYKKQTEAKQ